MHIFVDIFTCPAGSSCVCWPSSCCPWCSRCWSGPACPSRSRSAWSPARPCSRRCCPGPKWRGLQELDIARGWQTKTRCCRGLIWGGLLGLDFDVVALRCKEWVLRNVRIGHLWSVRHFRFQLPKQVGWDTAQHWSYIFAFNFSRFWGHLCLWHQGRGSLWTSRWGPQVPGLPN